jgi:hypothetical protein
MEVSASVAAFEATLSAANMKELPKNIIEKCKCLTIDIS